MKKILNYFAVALLLMAVSCTQELPEVLEGEKAFGEISLEFLSAKAIQTRADFPAGDADGDYNENVIYTLDYFIFDVDPRTYTTTEPFLSGRFTFIDGIEPVDEQTAKANAKPVSLEGTPLINADGTAKKGYVYAIANLPSSVTLPTSKTYETLQGLEMAADFAKLTSGKFTPQESFVMNGIKEFTPTLTGDKTVLVELSRRASKITLDMNVIKLIEQYSTNNVTQEEIYQGTWVPNVAKMQVYLTYANRYGLMDGSYLGRTYSDAKFFTYNRYAYQPTIDEDGVYQEMKIARDEDGHIIYDPTTGNPQYVEGASFEAFEVTGTPFYSYPMTWKTSDSHAPFIKIIIPWVKYDLLPAYRKMDEDTRLSVINALAGFPASTQYGDRVTTAADMTNRNGNEFYYKINLPTIIDDDDTGALQANNWYKIELDVAVLGSETDDLEVRLDGQYYAVDWSQPSDLGGDLFAGRYLTVAGSSLSNDQIQKLPQSIQNRIPANVPVYEAYSNTVSIPIISSHVFNVVSATATYQTFTGNGSTQTLQANQYTFTPKYDVVNGSYLKLDHEFVTNVNSFGNNGANAKDVSPIVYNITVRHSDTGGNADWITRQLVIIQYPPIYISQIEGGNVFVDGYFQYLDAAPTGYSNPVSYTWHSSKPGYRSANFRDTQFTYTATPRGNNDNHEPGTENNGYNYVVTPYGAIGYDGKNPTKMTLVTVTAFDSDSRQYSMTGAPNTKYEYTIADPRKKQSWTGTSQHLTPYLTSQASSNNGNVNLTSQSWESYESSIQVGSGNTLISNNLYAAPIAPAFLISSRWGRPGGGGSFPQTLQQAEQRCATYQEAGYPAGRWRLPTEAEINFVYKLQQKGLVDNLFTTSGYVYWASSVRYFGGDSGSDNFITPSGNRSTSIRCVYDYWYWGDETVDVHKFVPKP